ncbi:MAG TPA: putative lipid II flippase FtsW [Pseudomonadales bacterium]|nr:putative lipid II flippase FtsW [Pseudomonadales bacterium]
MVDVVAPKPQLNDVPEWRWIALTTVALMCIGLVMMTSASMDIGAQKYDSAFFHLKRHSMYIVIAVSIAFVVSRIPMQFWFKYGWAFLLFSMVLLSVVLIPGIGREVNGSRRWLVLGPLTLQASEVAKVCVLFYMASYLQRRQDEVQQHWMGFIKPIIVLVVLIVMLLSEPDFGAVVVLLGCTMGLIFLAGVKMGQFLSMILLCLGAVVAMAMSSEYRMRRLLAFQDPWADQFSSGYQLVQSLIAFGRGEWTGVGLGHSVQKLFYLPEAHTDFVFAILAEELGLMGVLVTISLFAVLVGGLMRLSRRAMDANQPFMAYIAAGAGLIIAGQAFINIGVTSGLLPTKGLTLPFVSYGGSSLIACCCLIALAYRIQFELLHGSSMQPQAIVKVRRSSQGGVKYANA